MPNNYADSAETTSSIPVTPSFSYLKKGFTSPYVLRREISNFTRGMLSPYTLSNLDSQGKGPTGRFKAGRNTAYPVDALISWLEARSCIKGGHHAT